MGDCVKGGQFCLFYLCFTDLLLEGGIAIEMTHECLEPTGLPPHLLMHYG